MPGKGLAKPVILGKDIGEIHEPADSIKRFSFNEKRLADDHPLMKQFPGC